MADNDFDFRDWAKESKLASETQKALRSQGLYELEVLLLVKPGDIRRAGISLGQEVLVRRALGILGNTHFIQLPAKPASSPPSVTEENTPEQTLDPKEAQSEVDVLLSAGKTLDELLNGCTLPTVNDAVHVAAQAPSMAYDPRILLTVRSTGKKAEKIANFLPEKVKDRLQRKRRDRMVLSTSEDGRISLKQNEEDLSGITIAEWGSANMKLMNYLMSTGDLSRDKVEFYLAYTMQVFEMVDVYDWSSILQFDQRYRELQAAHGFPWGDMRMALQMQLLAPRKTIYHGHHQQSTRPSATAEECKLWLNSGGKFCAFGSKCKYVHKRFPDATEKDPKNGQ